MKHYRIPAVIRINQCSSANRPTDRYMCTMQSTVVPSTQQMTATAMTQPTMIAMISTTVRPLAADDRYTSVTHTHTHTSGVTRYLEPSEKFGLWPSLRGLPSSALPSPLLQSQFLFPSPLPFSIPSINQTKRSGREGTQTLRAATDPEISSHRDRPNHPVNKRIGFRQIIRYFLQLLR